MPFTPYHLGPGLFLKALAPRAFSFTAFAATQVVIDVETLVHIVRHEWPLHRTAHTFLFGSLIGFGVAGVLYLAATLSRRWTVSTLPVLTAEVSLLGLVVGGWLGGSTHALLDGLMHSDIRPFAPFADVNPLLGSISLGMLHGSCMVLGVVAFIWLTARAALWRAG